MLKKYMGSNLDYIDNVVPIEARLSMVARLLLSTGNSKQINTETLHELGGFISESILRQKILRHIYFGASLPIEVNDEMIEAEKIKLGGGANSIE